MKESCSGNELEKNYSDILLQGEAPKISASCPRELEIESSQQINRYISMWYRTKILGRLYNKLIKFKTKYDISTSVDKTTNGLEYLQTYNKYKSDGYLNFSGPQNNTLVFGFSLEIHTNFQATRNNFLNCSKYKNICEISGIGINTHLSFFRSDKHSLAIIALCRSPRGQTIWGNDCKLIRL
ncbi:hypothetical protein PFLG_01137 [Plasmodium falciparum RAJ116]|uniref:Uncharacterized protein n=1 Tax=Plasmodium falciparum RAJ116 TaxID=580058 RepID=A0A0L0CXU8_PLAFA|nr:hypothetical protein PFLG_01137 [Plasmodium falciparum RAJ116]